MELVRHHGMLHLINPNTLFYINYNAGTQSAKEEVWIFYPALNQTKGDSDVEK
jgi:hypothetical protein